jgi:hypothetical protein
MKLLWSAPQKPEKDEAAVRVLKMIHGENTPAFFAALGDYGRKLTTHAPAASAVSYGSPVPIVLPDGTTGYAQPGNKPGAQPQVMAGPGGTPLVKPADASSKMPAELQRMQIAGNSMVRLMDDYEAALKKNNPRDPLTQMNPAVRADMQALKRNIELQFKELQALGALAGPDIEIIRQSLSDPFSASGAFYGREGLMSQIKRARELVKIRAEEVARSQGKSGSDATTPQAEDPLGLRGGKP